MNADPRLLAHPAVRAETERLAREFNDAQVLRWTEVGIASAAEAFGRLLSDASRPASRDWMARRIAEAIGWDHWRVSRAAEGSEPEEWRALMDACGVPERERRLASAAALTLAFLAVVR